MQVIAKLPQNKEVPLKKILIQAVLFLTRMQALPYLPGF